MDKPIFEAGQEYRTRDGSRARIYAVDGAGDQPIHGAAILENDKGWWPAQWSATGWYYLDGATDDLDLMPPEPEKETMGFQVWRNGQSVAEFVYFTVDPDGTLKLVR